jgi:cyanophycinase
MRRWVFAGVALFAMLFAASPVSAAGAVQENPATKVGPARGALMIVGGGSMAGLWPAFLELAGGKDAEIVVIPTANETVTAEDRVVGALLTLGAKRVVQLHTRDRAVADTEEFVTPLRDAAGV